MAAKPRFAVAVEVRALPRTLERDEVMPVEAAVLLRATVLLRRAVGVDLRLFAEEFKVRLAIIVIPPVGVLQQLLYQRANSKPPLWPNRAKMSRTADIFFEKKILKNGSRCHFRVEF
jgi:hypothetical protein